MRKMLSRLMRAKEGQVNLGPVSGAVTIFFGLFVIGILIFAFVLAGASMAESTDDQTAKEVINKTIEGAQQYANFSPVLWVMAGIGLLLTILFLSIGAFFVLGRN